MNSNKLIPILGLLLLLILAIGSISASEMDSDSIGDCDADIDLTAAETAVEEIDDSDIVDNANADDIIADSGENEIVSDDIESIDDVESEVGVKNSLGASSDDEVLASTVKFTESNYSTYFNKSGNIISGKLKSGDTLDFSGTFNSKTFIINIPLTITSTDGTASFTNCNFKIVKGAQGTKITNLKASMDKLDTPIFDVFNVSSVSISNCDLFSNATHSYPILLNTVNNSNVFNNKIKTTCYVTGWGHPSGIVLSGTFYNNISNNNVITNDSNCIYLTGYLGGGDMGQGGGVNAYNLIFNNTIHSMRGIEWALDEGNKTPLPSSFTYGIQVMGAHNDIINNTIYNVYRGIGATQSGNKIIGNVLSNIHGTWYSGNTNDDGGDYAIYVTTNSLVKDNIISDSNIDASGAVIYAAKNSTVSGNIIRNCIGVGVNANGNDVTITDNIFNLSGYGVYIKGNFSDINIESNIIDSGDYQSVYLERGTRFSFPHDIIIQNNTFYSTATEAIYKDNICTNILESNNIIIGTSGEPIIDDETLHLINENNFYKYFSLTGAFNNLINDNDTIIFLGSFSSKGKLNINKKVTILGLNAVFEDTTFIIEDNDGVIIENITINNPNTILDDRLWGIQISKSNNVTVKGCNISIYDPYSSFAIYVLDSDDCKIINNSLEAKGNYFTVGLFSFNSTNLLIDGNSIKTIGPGETYLCNDQSCLNILIKGVTICPDGTIICPDGTQYNPGEYEICADGTIICPDGTTICADGTTICADGTQICADGTMICVDGTTICADGTIICADGTQYSPSEYTTCADGSIICPDGRVICIDGTIYGADEMTILDNGTRICPDGTVLCPDGTVLCTDGSTICPDGRTICADGTIICADGYKICTDGSIMCPDGTVYSPEECTYDGTTIICPDGTQICADGKVICPDGTVICPDGTGGTGLLDGVIPGTHMISGLFRTYGVLFVHSSNNIFTNNIVNVSSALDPFYKLNESCNTIAGVFIHYGGFNNTIAGNNITLDSNDPVIYGIGIVGASSNSTAIGSKNNSFVNNNVFIKGPFHGVGIYLGYKAINSTFANSFTINAINAHEVVNRTLVENDENNLDGNTFDIITPHNTVLSVSNASFKWNNENKTVVITLKDINGNAIGERTVVFTLNGVNYTGVTNSLGVATVKVGISKVGTYDIVAYFNGDEMLIASTATGKMTVNKDSTSLSSSGKTYTVTASPKSITVTLKDASGKAIANKKITATVNGKTYTATTNSKGVATFKLKLTAVKTYTVSLKFAGDSYYTASSKSLKVKVTKTKTKLTVPKKTYKKSAKVKKLTATLKDQTGKVIKSKKVTFTVNGKKYTAKTNKKGVATVKVKLSKKKTYKVTVKFAGDKTYYAVKKTGKVVIK